MKRRTIPAVSLVVFSVAMASCAHRGPEWTEAAFDKDVHEYLGKPIRRVIDDYGYPQEQLESPEGRKVYEYRFHHSHTTPMRAYTNFHEFGSHASTFIRGGETYLSSCTVWFELKDEDGEKRVRDIVWRGNACRAPAVSGDSDDG